MRLLRKSWSRLLLPMGLIGLSLNVSPIRAAETSNQSVADADEVNFAKLQSGGRIVFVSSGLVPFTRLTATDGPHFDFLARTCSPL
jgi:hypothetical protein